MFRRQKQRGEELAVGRGPWRLGARPMVQPAQWLVRQWSYVILISCCR